MMGRFVRGLGRDYRDPAAFNDPVLRQRYFVGIMARCKRMRESIKALNRRPVPNIKDVTERLRIMSGSYVGLKREIDQIWDSIEEMKKKRLPIPDDVHHEVFTVKTILEEILKGLAPPCSGR
jgi:hypothetical protein